MAGMLEAFMIEAEAGQMFFFLFLFSHLSKVTLQLLLIHIQSWWT